MEKIEKIDGWLDWNTLTLDQMVEYLEHKYALSSSGDAKCIFSLIEYYKQHKVKSDEDEKIDIFKKASETVEFILEEYMNMIATSEILTQHLLESGKDIVDKRKFYSHMNALFLNVLLNRLSEVGHIGEAVSLECRKILCIIIKGLDNV